MFHEHISLIIAQSHSFFLNVSLIRLLGGWHLCYLSLLLLYLFFFKVASLHFVHLKKCFSFLFQYFFVVQSMGDNCGEWMECMGVASGCGEQEAGVASGRGWNLWVWL